MVFGVWGLGFRVYLREDSVGALSFLLFRRTVEGGCGCGIMVQKLEIRI